MVSTMKPSSTMYLKSTHLQYATVRKEIEYKEKTKVRLPCMLIIIILWVRINGMHIYISPA